VLADAGYGLSAPFRQGLTTRGLAWAVGIPRHLKFNWPLAKKASLLKYLGVWIANHFVEIFHTYAAFERRMHDDRANRPRQ
jgi:hypothetical protein